MGSSATAGPLGGPGSQSADAGLQGSGARPGPLGRAPSASAAGAGAVVVVFQPDGAPIEEAIPAANQRVYIDLTVGAMAQVATDAQGRLTGLPAGSSLDASRSYQVVVSPTDQAVAPTPAQGAAVRLANGKLPVTPRISVKVNRNSSAAARLACKLKVGSTESNVTTTPAGWVISNDTASGEVTVSSARFVLQATGAAAAAVTMSIAPSPPIRGASATVAFNIPAGVRAFKATEWKYEVSHTNPGATSALTATVRRPATEAAATFDQNWAGEMACSGVAKAKFVAGAVVRASGDAVVNVTLEAVDPIEVTLDVTVGPRTGSSWTATLTENAVGTFTRPIAHFEDTGHHLWVGGAWGLSAVHRVASGPNKGCQLLTSATSVFTSTPEINTELSDATTAFSLAQGKAYLTSPAPVRVIPSNLYTVGTSGAITQTPADSIATHFGITGNFNVSPQCIGQPALLAGTRRHESEDPPPGAASHKGNCLKALRALDPVKFAEALAEPPGASVNFNALMPERVNLVVSVAATHSVVDEATTLTAQALRFASGSILDVNANAAGTVIGPVWNPVANAQLTN